MRTHLVPAGKQKTLCGARLLPPGNPNRPSTTDIISTFERIPRQNRCIKCGQMLIRFKTILANRQEKAARHAEIDKLWDQFVARLENAAKLLGVDKMKEGEDAEGSEQTPQQSG